MSGMRPYGVVFAFLAAAAPAQQRSPLAVEFGWRQAALPHIESRPAVTSVDPELTRYATELGSRLAAVPPQPRGFGYRFLVFDDAEGVVVPYFGRLPERPRSYAFPGGVVMVALSLFEAAGSEAEFAAEVARGIAHISMRHYARSMYRRSLIRPVPPADPRLQPRPEPFPRALLFTRDLEREADYAAVGILAGAGIDPHALLRWARAGLALPDTTELRMRAIEQTIAKLPALPYGPDDSPRFEMLKSRVRHAVPVRYEAAQ